MPCFFLFMKSSTQANLIQFGTTAPLQLKCEKWSSKGVYLELGKRKNVKRIS